MELQQAYVKSISGKINALRSVDSAQALSMLQAVKRGPWTGVQVDELAKCISDKVNHEHDSTGAMGSRISLSFCTLNMHKKHKHCST